MFTQHNSWRLEGPGGRRGVGWGLVKRSVVILLLLRHSGGGKERGGKERGGKEMGGKEWVWRDQEGGEGRIRRKRMEADAGIPTQME